MKMLHAFCFSILLLATGAMAQNAPATEDTSTNPAFWQAKFVDGGHYLVKLANIVSASKHEYIGNAAARVVEVTIGTDSAVVARFYFLEPIGKDTPVNAGQIVMNRTQDVANQVSSRVLPNAAKLQVNKDYPNTTHAHTVEYVTQTEDSLKSLYNSLVRAIETGRGRTWVESK